MPVIQQMPAHLADLIAAGEVVERPASVAKELIENAVDAGAKTITIEIKNGGMTFLRVTDDGCGMGPEDAQTAFLRHATSKLKSEEQLGAIGTLGFRGEALAAIAAVSRIDLMTRQAGSDTGTALHLEAGTVMEQGPAGCPVGTTMIVRDLFYNTPARMKYMKRDTAEAAAVTGVVQRQALARPAVSLRYLKDGQEQLRTPGDGDLNSAVYAVLGRQAALDMVKVEGKWESIRITGQVSRPTASRGNRNYQHFFVNGRHIKSKSLTAALEQAYQNQLMVNRYPACVLHLTVPLETVDVNVHPAKTEVKFLTEKDVFDCVYYGVLAALNRTPGKPEMQSGSGLSGRQAGTAQPDRQPARQTGGTAALVPQQSFYRTMTAEQYRAEQQKPAQTAPAARPAGTGTPLAVHESVRTVYHSDRRAAPDTQTPPGAEPAPRQAGIPVCPVLAAEEAQEAQEAQELQAARKAQEARQSLPEEPAPAADAAPAAPWRIVGEVLRTYIIVEEGDHVLFIDKHAAHERVLFEKFRARENPVMAQGLLQPVPADLQREEAAVVLENQALLEQFGFYVEEFGDGTVLLRQVPADLDPAEAERTLQELAGKLLAGQRMDPAAVYDELLHTVACKAAIKAGDSTAPEELEALVREVLERDDIKYCPHGRPVCVTMTQAFLEKQFKRS